VLKDNSIISAINAVKAFDKHVYFIVKKFTDTIDSIPILNMHYSEIGVYTKNVTHLSNEFCINLSDIKYKCFITNYQIQLPFVLLFFMKICYLDFIFQIFQFY
jgi:hypothetical protein